MPPDSLPPDDEREPDARDANVVDSEVLAERRAQRAEHAERSATRRAADAQSLAADLARERARLEAERDAARAEAAAAREGADAVKAEAQHLQAERDALRIEVERGEAEREALRSELDQMRVERGAADVQPAAGGQAPAARSSEASRDAEPRNGGRRAPNGNGATVPATWAAGLRRELAVARTASSRPSLVVVSATVAQPATMASLGREREIVARRAGDAPSMSAPVWASRTGERATPLTALALERERSNRLRAELERAAAIEAELRAQLAALEHAVEERREAERRIEAALKRVRGEFDAAPQLAASASPTSAPEAAAAAAAASPTAAPEPVVAAEAASPAAPAAAASIRGPVSPVTPLALREGLTAAPSSSAAEAARIDAERLDAAQARLRATVPTAEPDAVADATPAPPTGPPAPWLPSALRKLAREDPRAAGRILTAMLPAQGVVTKRELHYDLVLTDRGSVMSVDVADSRASVQARTQSRPRRDVDFRLTAGEEALARLLLSRRGRRGRRGTRVRGSRRRLRELRRLASEPLALRDLARAGAMRDPLLALSLVALAVEPAATYGHRFTIAHAPLAGGPIDAWLRVQNGSPLTAVQTSPPETPTLTIRSTRGALLPLLAGIAPPPGESAVLDGDPTALTLLQAWISRTEFPVS